MSFEPTETLPPHLLSIARVLQEHAAEEGLPLSVHFAVRHGSASRLAFADGQGAVLEFEDPSYPMDTAEIIKYLVGEAEVEGKLGEDCLVRLDSATDESVTVTIETGDTADAKEYANPGDLDSVPHAPNDGLKLRTALVSHGHTTGYSQTEIDTASRKFTDYLPELRFYRATVREGKIANGPHGDVLASPLDSTFGEVQGQEPQPIPRPSDIVQPLRFNPLWLAIAHDSQMLYAADLAPGASGKIGQIIGRTHESTLPPQLVAHSLAEFVAGEWVSAEEAALSWVAPGTIQQATRMWQLAPDSLENWTAESALKSLTPASTSTAEAEPIEAVLPAEGESIVLTSEPIFMDDAHNADFVPSTTDMKSAHDDQEPNKAEEALSAEASGVEQVAETEQASSEQGPTASEQEHRAASVPATESLELIGNINLARTQEPTTEAEEAQYRDQISSLLGRESPVFAEEIFAQPEHTTGSLQQTETPAAEPGEERAEQVDNNPAKSRQEMVDDFAAVAFGNNHATRRESLEQEPTQRKGGFREALRRFFMGE